MYHDLTDVDFRMLSFRDQVRTFGYAIPRPENFLPIGRKANTEKENRWTFKHAVLLLQGDF